MSKRALESNIWKYYLLSFLSTIQFYGPIFILFFQRFEFSMTQILFFLSAYSIATILLEVPSGMLADSIGRKKTLILASLASAASMAIFAISSSYAAFLVAYLIMGVGGSFWSGTYTAFIYDTLDNLKKKVQFKKIQGESHFISTIALVTSFLTGGFLFAIHFRLPYILTALVAFINIFVVLTLFEPKFKKSKTYKKNILGSLKLVFTNPTIRNLVLFSVLIVTGFVLSFFVNQPYLQMIGIPVQFIGVVLAAGSIINGLFAKYAYKIEGKLKEKLSLSLLPVGLILGYFLMSQFSFIYAFVFLFFISFTMGFSGPILNDYINAYIKKDRATTLSIKNFMTNVSFAVFAPLMGLLTDKTSLQYTFFITAIIIALLSIILLYLMFGRKSK